MKDKNKKLMIVVGVLLLVIGVSFAYFVSTVLIGGTGANIKASTASINGATIEVKGTISFNDLDIYPGHKTISGIELTATGEGEFIPYNLVWNGTNNLNTPLNFTVYKSDAKIETSATCNKTTKIENGSQILAEECNITNINALGSPIYNGTINKNQEKVILSNAEFITASKEGNKVYYYVILEYPNLNEEQNADIGGTFNGQVTVEENNSSADITIASIYKKENNEYKEVTTIPTGEEKYILNEERSTCTNSAKPTWNNETNSLQVNSLTISGTECNLYFDRLPTSEDTLDKLGITNVNETEPTTFASGATTDEGVFKTADPVYGGYTYYWRGKVTNNYVTFAGKCWRIVRINGDGSMRIIYDGTTCHANGTNTAESIAKTSIAYNTSYNNSAYVGWTYTASVQRPTPTTGGTASNAKTQLESWYNSTITGTNASKVADGIYCNDRTVGSGTWSATGSQFYYGAYTRVYTNKQPSLACDASDRYTLKVGLITADEVSMAGGVYGTNNTSYYLYNGQSYWTMSPYYWYSGIARVFFVNGGSLYSADVSSINLGLRPVINLKADTVFAVGGNGTQSNPYAVQ